MFQNRTLYVATKHQKEKVIQPELAVFNGLDCKVPNDLDTDLLGTFTGEIPRTLSPLDAAREKCRMAAKAYQADLIIGSEGSFGPHPILGFVPLNTEVLLLMDLKNDLEIKVVQHSTHTNFSSKDISTQAELLQFAHRAGFPQHGLILRVADGSQEIIHKGIIDTAELHHHFHELKKFASTVTIETDMRAMYNPKRMEVIRLAAKALVKRMQSICPRCSTPGFGPEGSERGLPCGDCGFPTRSILALILQCQRCGYEQKEFFPSGKQHEDPMYCDQCNP